MEAKDAAEEKSRAEDSKAQEAKGGESKGGSTPRTDGSFDVKIILLGDSAVGKSKLMERYLMGDYNPHQLSTYALNTFRKESSVDGKPVVVEFWDTAGQERFQKVHPAYYAEASACILVFDVTRKATYQHLKGWYDELRDACGNIPCILIANKIDFNYKVTDKKFKFSETHNLPFYFVSAADGTNVVRVFEQAIEEAVHHKERMKEKLARGEFDEDGGVDAFMAEVRDTLDYFNAKESS